MGLTAHCESPMLIFDTLEANGEKHTIKVKRCFSGFPRGLFTKSTLGRGMGRSPMNMNTSLTAACSRRSCLRVNLAKCCTALSERPMAVFAG